MRDAEGETAMNTTRPDHAKTRNRHSAGTAIAVVCILGIMAALWLRPERADTQVARAIPIGASPSHAFTDTDYLRAPAATSAIPSAEQVFGSRPYRTDDDAPPAPTF
jgi:hypothetical protein